MKKIKKIIALTMLAAAPFAIGGCDDEDKDDCKLNFITNNNKVYYTIISSGNEKIDLPEEPTKKGYTFGGWYLDEKFNTPFTSESFLNTDLDDDLNIYAKWDVINYNINYHLYEGINSSSNPNSYNINTNATLANPTKDNYTFVGWYLDEDYTKPVTVINSEFKGDLNVYAKWSIYDYEIIYHLGGGVNSNDNPSGYDKENNEIVLEDIYRTAYDFLGWYSDASYTTKITSIPANSTGNVNVYAKWEAIFDYSNGEIKGLTTYGENKKFNDLVIPSKIDEVTVKKIGVHAFYNNEFNSITIPKNVTVIENESFYTEKTLQVKYEGTLEEWMDIEKGSKAFNNDELFIGGQKVQEVVVPATVNNIKSNAFYGIKLNRVTLHEDVTSVDKNAFSNTNDTTNVRFNGTTTKWLNMEKGNSAFGKLYNLYLEETLVDNFVIPTEVKELKANALSGLNISTITVHSELTSIGENALDIDREIKIEYNGTIEQWLEISKKNHSIYNANLYIDNQMVTNIVVPESVVVIKENSLIGIKGIESITIHDDVTTIENNGLNNSSSLNVYYNGTVADWVKIDVGENSINSGSYFYIDNNKVVDLIIHEDTTKIKANAFASFIFESVTIHNDVTEIGENAFMKEGEMSIYCKVESKPSGWVDNWQIGNTVYFGNDW